MTNYNLHNDCKKLAQRVYPENRHIDTNGWSYKGTFSNHRNGFYAEVYTKGDKVILTFRGTEVKSGKKEGAKDGFRVSISIIPYLVAIIVGISMFKASGTSV